MSLSRKVGGQGAAGSENHGPMALRELLSITEFDLGVWAQLVWKVFKVQSGSNFVIQSTGRSLQGTCCPPAFSELSSTNLATWPHLTSSKKATKRECSKEAHL